MEVITRYGLDELLVVANTRHGPGGHRRARATEGPDHDHLQDARDAHEFLVGHGVDVPESLPAAADLRRLREIREAVRSPVESGVDRRARLGLATYRLEARVRLEAASSGWDAVVDDMRLPLAELPKQAARLKVCGNPLCRFIFSDRSRNLSRRWCEMAACGNRAKVARHRAAASVR